MKMLLQGVLAALLDSIARLACAVGSVSMHHTLSVPRRMLSILGLSREFTWPTFASSGIISSKQSEAAMKYSYENVYHLHSPDNLYLQTMHIHSKQGQGRVFESQGKQGALSRQQTVLGNQCHSSRVMQWKERYRSLQGTIGRCPQLTYRMPRLYRIRVMDWIQGNSIQRVKHNVIVQFLFFVFYTFFVLVACCIFIFEYEDTDDLSRGWTLGFAIVTSPSSSVLVK